MKSTDIINKGITVASIWLAIVCGSCSNEICLTTPQDGVPVKVKASINGFDGVLTENGLKTAAADNDYDRSTFLDGDKISITKTYSGKQEASEYTFASSSSVWTPTRNALTLQAGATYQAEFPTDYSLQSSQKEMANYIRSNLLRTDVMQSPLNEEVNFTFKHMNTKLTLKFVPATGGPALSGSNFSFQVQAKGLLTGGTNNEIVTLYRPGSDFTWHGIVYPKKVATDISISVTYNNVNYNATLTGCELQAGYNYKYTLTIHNNILVPVGSEIKKWEPVPTYTGTLE
ncbi:fimbrillin family protein [Parabacteroides sp.]